MSPLFLLWRMITAQPRIGIVLIFLSIAAAQVHATLLLLIVTKIAGLLDLADRSVTLWMPLLTGLASVALEIFAGYFSRVFATDLEEKLDLPKPILEEHCRLLRIACALASILVMLFVFNWGLFLAGTVLLASLLRALWRATNESKPAMEEQRRAQAVIDESLAQIAQSPDTVRAYPEAVRDMLGQSIRADFIAEGQRVHAASKAGGRLGFWSLFRWYIVVFAALFLLPQYGLSPPTVLILLAYQLVLLDQFSSLYLAQARRIEAGSPMEQEIWQEVETFFVR